LFVVGTVVVGGPLSSVTIGFDIIVVSTTNGTAVVYCEDEFTYFTEGFPRVEDCIVTVREVFGTQRWRFLFNGTGTFTLPEGYYQITTQALDHNSDSRKFFLSFTGTDLFMFMPLQVISVRISAAWFVNLNHM
jgi:hypothetical protein